MSLKSIFQTLGHTYNFINHGGFDKVDPNLIRYFRTEYGKNWQIALENHIYQKSIKNQKKAA